jgi:hypothetical protein
MDIAPPKPEKLSWSLERLDPLGSLMGQIAKLQGCRVVQHTDENKTID